MNDIVDRMNASQTGSLPGMLGFRWTAASKGLVRGEFTVSKQHFSPHGYLHGGAIVAFADSACGFGCLASLPDGATEFVTTELKSNFTGSVRNGTVRCDASMVHAGRSLQVWDAKVWGDATGRTIAFFRCTQMLLYPRTLSDRMGSDTSVTRPEPRS